MQVSETTAKGYLTHLLVFLLTNEMLLETPCKIIVKNYLTEYIFNPTIMNARISSVQLSGNSAWQHLRVNGS